MSVRAWVLGAWLALPLAAPAQELTATVEKVERKVEAQRGGGAWEPAVPKMMLGAGDRIHTGFKATATVRFGDGSVVEVKPMSMVMLQKLEDPGGKVKTRIWMRMGEVKSKVERPTGEAADFEVRTTTVTASVRGTEVDSVRSHPGIGTRVDMGARGLIETTTDSGRAHLAKKEETQAKDPNEKPLTPDEVDRREQVADVQPSGTNSDEQDDVEDTGVPKTNPLNTGGSGLANNLVLQTLMLNTDFLPELSVPGSGGSGGGGSSGGGTVPVTRVIVPVPPLP